MFYTVIDHELFESAVSVRADAFCARTTIAQQNAAFLCKNVRRD